MTFVTLVTLNIKVTSPKSTGFLRVPLGSDIPSFKLTAVNDYRYHMDMGVFRWTNAQTDRQTDRQAGRQTDTMIICLMGV